MYNIGLDVINQTPKTNESLGSVIASLNDHFSSLSELINIKRSLIKYGRTDQLVELVQPTLEELNTTCSIEGISTTLSNIWKWIMDKVNSLIKLVKAIFNSLKSKAKDILAKLKKASEPDHNAFVGLQEKICSEKLLSNILTAGKKIVEMLKLIFDKIDDNIARDKMNEIKESFYDDLKTNTDEFHSITTFIYGDTSTQHGKASEVIPSWKSVILYYNKFVNAIDIEISNVEHILYTFKGKLNRIENHYNDLIDATSYINKHSQYENKDEDEGSEKVKKYARDSGYITNLIKFYIKDLEAVLSGYNRVYKKVVKDLLEMLNVSHNYHTNNIPNE